MSVILMGRYKMLPSKALVRPIRSRCSLSIAYRILSDSTGGLDYIETQQMYIYNILNIHKMVQCMYYCILGTTVQVLIIIKMIS